MKTSSRKAMQHSFITQEDRDGKAVRPFSPQDQTSKKPRIALAASSGTPVSPVTRRWAMLTRAILARDVLMVADTAWDCGQLLQALHAPYGLAVLPPIKASPTRLVECDAGPLEHSDQTIGGNGAAVSTTMTDFDGP